MGAIVTERHEEALDELRGLLMDIRANAEMSHYGYFVGGDPTSFSPDPECSTADEQEAHRLACEEWVSGKRSPLPGPHEPLTSESGEHIGYVTKSGFGLGVNNYEDEELRAWADTLDRCIERLETAS